MKVKKTKIGLVMSHLNRYGSITSLKAIDAYGATRLSNIIFCLKKRKGVNIETISIDMVDNCGNKGTYSKYVLKKK
jgi:hypothetical protein